MKSMERRTTSPAFFVAAYNQACSRKLLSEAHQQNLREVGVSMSLNLATRYYQQHHVEQLKTASNDVVAIASYGLYKLSNGNIQQAIVIITQENSLMICFRKAWERIAECIKMLKVHYMSFVDDVEAYHKVMEKLGWNPEYNWRGVEPFDSYFEDMHISNVQIAFQNWAKKVYNFRNPFTEDLTDDEDDNLLSEKFQTNLLASILQEKPKFSLSIKELTQVLMMLLEDEQGVKVKMENHFQVMLKQIPGEFQSLYQSYMDEMPYHLAELIKFAKKVQENPNVDIDPSSKLLSSFWITYY